MEDLGLLAVIALMLLAFAAGLGAALVLIRIKRTHKYLRSNAMAVFSLAGFGLAPYLVFALGLWLGVYGVLSAAFIFSFSYTVFCWLARR